MYQDKETSEYTITKYRHMFSIMESNIFQHLGLSMPISLTASIIKLTISILSIRRFLSLLKTLSKPIIKL